MDESDDESLTTEKAQAIVQVAPITREALQGYGFPEERVNQLSDADLATIRHTIEVHFQEILIDEIRYDIEALMEEREQDTEKSSWQSKSSGDASFQQR